MIDLNYSLQSPAKVYTPTFKQEFVQPQQYNYQGVGWLPNFPQTYNYIIVKENKDIITQFSPGIDFNSYQKMGQTAVSDVKSRAGKSGQVLDWIGILQNNQLKNLDSIYNLAAESKKGDYTDLVVLGMGGSRYPNEALIKMLGKDSKIHFYSAIDPQSFKNFSQNLDLDKTKILVVSKSGGTLETTIAYQNFRKLMQDYLKKEDVSDRFIAMTNQSSDKSKLRKLVDNGEIKYSGLVHDEISGGFSMFDDATLFTLAYSGVNEADAKKILQASLNAQKEFMNPDINKNEALKLAAFNVESKNNGNNKHFVEYFGDYFAGSASWEKQLKNEALKSTILTDTNIGPEYLHYITESDLDSNNKDSFYTFVYVKSQGAEDKATSALLNGAIKAYSEQHPVSKIELKDLSPETIGRFIELKHFETLYTGNMLRQKSNNMSAQEPLPEVMQTNVLKYKKEVKKNFDY